MSYTVKVNSFRRVLASDLAIKACCACTWPILERRPATPQAERLGCSGGAAVALPIVSEKFETTVYAPLDQTQRRSVFSSC